MLWHHDPDVRLRYRVIDASQTLVRVQQQLEAVMRPFLAEA